LHVGNKMIQQLIANIRREQFDHLFSTVPSEDFVIKSVRLACLLHDIGHGPFSHAAEGTMLRLIKLHHADELDQAKTLFNEFSDGKLPIHEFFSYKLITEGEIATEIKSIEGESAGIELINSVSELLIKSDGKYFKSNPVGYSILRKLVSSQLDADRMDFLLRDSNMSGVKFGLIDVDRIINNMRIVKRKETFELAIHERAVGSIEDMLDARYKMYRWFYNHHTVVVTNFLTRLAINLMISDSAYEKLFHWSSFSEGHSTDDFILSRLVELVKDPKYHEVKGLVDRRYMPISLLKSIPDFRRFVKLIRKYSGIEEDKETILTTVRNFFGSSDSESLIKVALEREGNEIGQCNVYFTGERLKIYKPFLREEKVFLYRNEGEDLCELWSESEYFKSINTLWSRYHGLYLFYLIPNRKRQDFSQYREKITDILAQEIVKFSK